MELIQKFTQYLILVKNLSENSIKGYKNDLYNFQDYLNSQKLQFDAVSTLHIEQYLASDKFKNKRTTTKARSISAIKAFYKYLVLDNYLEESPAQKIHSPKKEIYLPSILTLEEIDQIISLIDQSNLIGLRDKVIVEMLFGSGIRVSELCHLKLDEIYFDDGYFKVLGKGNKQRLVPLGEVAAADIKHYHLKLKEIKGLNFNKKNYLILNKSGLQLSRVSVFKRIKYLVKKAGITKEISPHTFRHSFATILIQNGAELRSVQQMLGHESITTTEIYTHINNTQLKETIQKYHPRAAERPLI